VLLDVTLSVTVMLMPAVLLLPSTAIPKVFAITATRFNVT
jgi:hypothetical protein